MIRADADVVVLGAGFAGSLAALVLHRVGKQVVLVERGSHPRFALGESSTPLASLTLAEMARRYDLPRLLPLAKYGSWVACYPHLMRGKKRGFTFARHDFGRPFVAGVDHENELLVAASPADDVADTHWLRADFDQFLAGEVVAAGIPYLDRTALHALEPGARWKMTGERQGEGVELTAAFAIDATASAGVLAAAAGVGGRPGGLQTNSWSVFNHFAGVDLWETVVAESGGRPGEHPYHCDDAALHHVFDDGWMWVLRFDDGVTSAGFLLDGEKRQPDPGATAEEEWGRLLGRCPGIARQFRRARPLRGWTRTPRLQRRAARAAGENWALLAPAAYTLDALYSTGNGHALLSVQRLARLVEETPAAGLPAALARYDEVMQREIAFLDMLVHGSYRALGDFRLLSAFTMYYFAGAIASEERRRQGKARPDEEFLSSDVPEFRAAVARAYRTLGGGPVDVAAFERQAAADVAPWNTVGLCDPGKRNLYPY
jgi:FADH2 O2-dependent halogenase